jgi:hypothetical protein
VLEEYIIQPADVYGDSAGARDILGRSHIKLYTPEDGNAWVAMPLSSVTGSQRFISRPGSFMQQGTPRRSSVPFMDPMVPLMGSFRGNILENLQGYGSTQSHLQGGHHFDDFNDDEEIGEKHHDVNDEYTEEDEDEGLTSPLLSTNSSRFWDRDKVFRNVEPAHGGSFMGSLGSTAIGGGWQLAFQWTGPEGTEGKADQGEYKRVYLFQETPADGAPRGVSTYSLPRFGSTMGDVESIPAAALVSRPSQYGKSFHLDNQVGPAMIHPAELATKGPAWSELFDGGVKQALIVGVTLQILEQVRDR